MTYRGFTQPSTLALPIVEYKGKTGLVGTISGVSHKLNSGRESGYSISTTTTSSLVIQKEFNLRFLVIHQNHQPNLYLSLVSVIRFVATVKQSLFQPQIILVTSMFA